MNAFNIGANDTNSANFFDGDLDDLRIYRVALNADEVSRLYGAGSGDFGVRAIEITSSPTLSVPMPVTLRFLRDGSPIEAAGFTLSDLSVTGGAAAIKQAPGVYAVGITPDNLAAAGSINFVIPAASAAFAQNLPFPAASATLEYGCRSSERRPSRLTTSSMTPTEPQPPKSRLSHGQLTGNAAFDDSGKFGRALTLPSVQFNTRMEIPGVSLDPGLDSLPLVQGTLRQHIHPHPLWTLNEHLQVRSGADDLGMFLLGSGGFVDSGFDLPAASFSIGTTSPSWAPQAPPSTSMEVDSPP